MRLLATAATSLAVWAVAAAGPVSTANEVAIAATTVADGANMIPTETVLDDTSQEGDEETFRLLEAGLPTAAAAATSEEEKEDDPVVTTSTDENSRIATFAAAATDVATAFHKDTAVTAVLEAVAVAGAITAAPTTTASATFINPYGDETVVDDLYVELSQSLWISPIGENDEQFNYEPPERMILSTVQPITTTNEAVPSPTTITTTSGSTAISDSMYSVETEVGFDDIIDSMFNDTKILHALAQSDVDTVEICKSYAFDPSQINWHLAKTEEWLRQYTLENKHREHFKRNGVISTIAFDFLGLHGFKCAIGFAHLCTIDCPTVVRYIEDLELARNVYFTLASASHLLSVLDTAHGTMEAAQMNLQGMIQKMSMDFFYTSPTMGERERQRLWHFFVQLTIWSVQTAINSVVPLIPWSTIQDYVIYRASKASNVALDTGPRLDRFGDPEFDQWRGAVLEETLGDIMYFQGITGDATLTVPPSYGGHDRWNPGGATVQDWMRVNAGAERRWYHYFFDTPLPMDTATAEVRVDSREGWFPDFRRRAHSDGVLAAISHAWKDFKELVRGTADREAGAWWWAGNSGSTESLGYLDHQRHTEPPSFLEPGQQLASIGPMESWHPSDQWRHEYGQSRHDMLLDIWTRGLASQLEYRYPPPMKDTANHLMTKLDNVRIGLGKLYPITFSLAMPMYIRETMESFTFSGTDRNHDVNSANLAFMVQESGRYSRRIIKQNVNTMFESSVVGPEGETHISNALSMGSYLPVDKGTLANWTDATIEDSVTKNMYYKTLDSALRSQKHWIQCTTHLLRKQHINSILHKKVKEVPVCVADNTGPEHLRTCIPVASGPEEGKEMVCYMYRWADRGLATAHHIEDPWGWQKYQAFDLSVQDITTSSFLTRLYRLYPDSTSTPSEDPGFPLLNTRTIAFGPGSQFVTDPGNPGMFSIPVCVSPYNWNGHTNGYSVLDDVNVNSAKKSLPCYCGPLGAETSAIWSALRLDVSGKRKEYLTHLCPRQIAAKMTNPLERYIAKCRLGIKKIGALHYEKKDHLCDVVLYELVKHGIQDIHQLTDQQVVVAMCKIKQGWHKRLDPKWTKKCGKFIKTPVSNMWDEAEAMSRTSAKDALNDLEKDRLEEVKAAVSHGMKAEKNGAGEGLWGNNVAGREFDED